jgi:hypothetical protein
MQFRGIGINFPYHIQTPLLEWAFNNNYLKRENKFLFSSSYFLTFLELSGICMGAFEQGRKIIAIP